MVKSIIHHSHSQDYLMSLHSIKPYDCISYQLFVRKMSTELSSQVFCGDRGGGGEVGDIILRQEFLFLREENQTRKLFLFAWMEKILRVSFIEYTQRT